jgi:hypothetical protein
MRPVHIRETHKEKPTAFSDTKTARVSFDPNRVRIVIHDKAPLRNFQAQRVGRVDVPDEPTSP